MTYSKLLLRKNGDGLIDFKADSMKPLPVDLVKDPTGVDWLDVEAVFPALGSGSISMMIELPQALQISVGVSGRHRNTKDFNKSK